MSSFPSCCTVRGPPSLSQCPPTPTPVSPPPAVGGGDPPESQFSLCLYLFIYFCVKTTKRCLVGPEGKLSGKWVLPGFLLSGRCLRHTRAHIYTHSCTHALNCTRVHGHTPDGQGLALPG